MKLESLLYAAEKFGFVVDVRNRTLLTAICGQYAAFICSEKDLLNFVCSINPRIRTIQLLQPAVADQMVFASLCHKCNEYHSLEVGCVR